MFRVGIDLDGVVFNFADSLRRYLKHAGHHNKYDIGEGETSTWDFYKDWGLTLDEFVKHCHDGVDAGFVFRGGQRDGATEAIRRIRSFGHSIHIITDRAFGATPKASQRATLEWLAEHDIPYDSLHFSADKTIVETDYFVEDKLENYDKLEAAGVETYLVNRPWNKEVGDKRRRISGIAEFAHVIEEKTFDFSLN